MQKLLYKYTQDDKDLLNTPDVKTLLRYMYTHHVVALDDIEDDTQINKVEASWYFSDLLDLNFIQRYGKDRNADKYSLTYKGRTYIKRNIL